MPATPTLALPYPALTDPPNGPQAVQLLAEAVENLLKAPFGRMGITSGFVPIDNANGVYPTVASQVLKNGMTFNSNSLLIPKAGLYEINMKAYFTGGGGVPFLGTATVTINSSAAPPAAAAAAFGTAFADKRTADDYTIWASVRRQLSANDRLRLWMRSLGAGSTFGTDGYNGSFVEAVWLQP